MPNSPCRPQSAGWSTRSDRSRCPRPAPGCHRRSGSDRSGRSPCPSTSCVRGGGCAEPPVVASHASSDVENPPSHWPHYVSSADWRPVQGGPVDVEPLSAEVIERYLDSRGLRFYRSRDGKGLLVLFSTEHGKLQVNLRVSGVRSDVLVISISTARYSRAAAADGPGQRLESRHLLAQGVRARDLSAGPDRRRRRERFSLGGRHRN